MKKLFISLLCLMPFFIMSQTIDANYLNEIRSGFKNEGQTKALQNVLSNDKDLRSNALNRELQGRIDHYFKYRVNVKGITDQKSSGRCWMFTSMNVLRPSLMAKYGLNEFDFSHNYLYFFDLLEKSNLFLENIIQTAQNPYDDRKVVELLKSPVSDGGVWNLYFNIAGKYGLVPQEVMPETAHSESTAQLLSILAERLRGAAYQIREALNQNKKANVGNLKKETMSDVYRILALCLGEPPSSFTWRYKDKDGNIKELRDYSPLQFYKDITPGDYSPDNYIMIMNDPTREYYKLYEIENYRNSIEGINWLYLNLPNEDIKKAALASIKNNEAMYASCDVGKQFNRSTGILDPSMYEYEKLFGIKLDMDKKARILTRQSGSSHAMTLIACDTDENDRPLKWEFENSWGASSGNKGYLTFTDEWFNEYMFRIVIHKKYLDKKAIDSLNQKPIQLPMWDYMF